MESSSSVVEGAKILSLIDVVIRASRDPRATQRCRESLLAAHCGTPFEVVEAPLPAAAGLHPGRDLVIVSGDCEVPDGWLDRLAACAARDGRAATVTPFSNHGGPCSYPRFGERNALPPGHTTASLDALFRAENREISLELPASGGFCTYVTRAALAAAGPFEDEAAFAAAATAAGFRHVLCGDLFVRHEGELPRPPETGDPAERLRDFAEREPARPLRRRVDLARLRASSRPRLLVVTHNWGGGVERHVRDLAALLAEDREVLRLRPDGPSVVELAWLREGEELQAWFEVAEWEGCVALLASLGIARVHLHHVHELPRPVLELPAALGVPYDVTLHDYFPVCPRYHLAPGEADQCPRDAAAGCRRCGDRDNPWGLTLAEWRGLFRGFLEGAARVIVPSHDAATRLRRYFPGVAAREWPHPESARAIPPLAKVLLLGGVSEIKGARVLEKCIADAMRRGLPLHFHVVGHLDRPMPAWPEAPLTVGGSYPEERLAEAIALARPDAFLFLSQVPETYSYTLTAAMQSGLPVVATRLGAFPERLRGYRAHVLVNHDAPASAINDALLACLRRAEVPAAAE